MDEQPLDDGLPEVETDPAELATVKEVDEPPGDDDVTEAEEREA